MDLVVFMKCPSVMWVLSRKIKRCTLLLEEGPKISWSSQRSLCIFSQSTAKVFMEWTPYIGWNFQCAFLTCYYIFWGIKIMYQNSCCWSDLEILTGFVVLTQPPCSRCPHYLNPGMHRGEILPQAWTAHSPQPSLSLLADVSSREVRALFSFSVTFTWWHKSVDVFHIAGRRYCHLR